MSKDYFINEFILNLPSGRKHDEMALFKFMVKGNIVLTNKFIHDLLDFSTEHNLK